MKQIRESVPLSPSSGANARGVHVPLQSCEILPAISFQERNREEDRGCTGRQTLFIREV